MPLVVQILLLDVITRQYAAGQGKMQDVDQIKLCPALKEIQNLLLTLEILSNTLNILHIYSHLF
jgi:hypothetical protein